MNWIGITGHLGRDPEMQYISSGTAKTVFSLANNSGSGEYERTDWFNVECWDRLAENVNQYLGKGSKVLVEGQMLHDEYMKDGEKKHAYKIKAFKVEFLDKKEDTPQYADASEETSEPSQDSLGF